MSNTTLYKNILTMFWVGLAELMVKSLHNVNSIQIHLNVPPYSLSFSCLQKDVQQAVW